MNGGQRSGRPVQTRRAILSAALILLVFCGLLSMGRSLRAADTSGVALAQEGPVQPANSQEVFGWIDGLLRTQPATVARFEASVGTSFHRVERNDWFAAYETSTSPRPWARRVELRLPERTNQGWSFFLILDLDPARLEILPGDAESYRPGARVGANPTIPPGWQGVWKYWVLAAPDFLLWENGSETIVFRFRSEGPRRLQQCSLYRKTAAPPPERQGRRAAKSSSRSVETGLGPSIDALLGEAPEAAAQVQALQGAGWRLSWAPVAISAIDLVQKAIFLPKDKNAKKSFAWLLWELGQMPSAPSGIAAARPGE